MRTAKYLVCVDQRPESRVALRFACILAQARGSKVDVLHVIPPGDFQSLGSIAERMRAEQLQEAEQMLRQVVNDTINNHSISPNILIREGIPGEQIIAAAMEDHEVSIVMIGVAQQATGRGTLTGWLASQLGNQLFIPLLMVPGNLTDQQLESLI